MYNRFMRVGRRAGFFLFGAATLAGIAGCAPNAPPPHVPPPPRVKVEAAPIKNVIDYIAVGPRMLLAAVEPLLVHREKLGLRVQRLVLEDIVPSTENQEDATGPILAAIRKIAADSGTRLRFILLVGDAPGYNELDDERSLLPTFYRRKIQYWDDDPFGRDRAGMQSDRLRRMNRIASTEYATDLPYAQANIDAPGQPSLAANANPRPLAVGRIPARLPKEVEGFAQKVIQYETAKSTGTWRRSMTIFTSPANFGALADFMIENTMTRLLDDKVPYDWDVDITFPKIGSPFAYPFPDLQDKLISRLDAGALIAGYVGHGAPTHFDDVHYNYNYYQLGSTWDLERLRIGDGKPFFLALTCSNGFFDLGERMQSVAEVLVLNPGGAIAAFASSRVSHPYPNALYGDAIIQSFVSEHASSIGEGIVTAKLRMREGDLPLAPLLFESNAVELAEEHLGLYNLFGDPATVLQYPSVAKVTLDEPQDALFPGFTVNLTVEVKDVPVGTALLTVETKRSVIRTPVPSAFALQRMPEPEMWETMRRTYAAATDKVVSRHEQPVKNGVAIFRVKLPDVDGEYAMKVFVTGSGQTSTGYVKVKVASPQPVTAP
jgi:hypothetical protein